MDRYIEHITEDDGTRYLPFPVEMTQAQMRKHAREMLGADAIQVTFVDQDRHETTFDREDA